MPLAHQPSAPSGHDAARFAGTRPDLRAQAAQVNAYAAKFASAKADLLPRFTISFMGQGGRIGVDGDRSLTGWASLLSVGIQTPLFTNGRIKPISKPPTRAFRRHCWNTTNGS